MKRSLPSQHLPLLPAVFGFITLLLRLGLYALEEPSGLLPQSHPLHIASLIVTTFAIGLVLCFVVPAKASIPYSADFSTALTIAFSALWMLPAAFAAWEQGEGVIGILWTVLAFAAVICLLVIAWCRWKDRRCHFLLHGILCLYFAIHMICYYRIWSGNPQLEDYLFPLFASIFLTLAAYYRANFDIRRSQHRRLLFYAYMAIYFCVSSLAGPGEKHFYFAGALWALADVRSIRPEKKQEETHDVSA